MKNSATSIGSSDANQQGATRLLGSSRRCATRLRKRAADRSLGHRRRRTVGGVRVSLASALGVGHRRNVVSVRSGGGHAAHARLDVERPLQQQLRLAGRQVRGERVKLIRLRRERLLDLTRSYAPQRPPSAPNRHDHPHACPAALTRVSQTKVYKTAHCESQRQGCHGF